MFCVLFILAVISAKYLYYSRVMRVFTDKILEHSKCAYYASIFLTSYLSGYHGFLSIFSVCNLFQGGSDTNCWNTSSKENLTNPWYPGLTICRSQNDRWTPSKSTKNCALSRHFICRSPIFHNDFSLWQIAYVEPNWFTQLDPQNH